MCTCWASGLLGCRCDWNVVHVCVDKQLQLPNRSENNCSLSLLAIKWLSVANVEKHGDRATGYGFNVTVLCRTSKVFRQCQITSQSMISQIEIQRVYSSDDVESRPPAEILCTLTQPRM